ncbi:hypothetical protein GA0074692_2379 [Micromonospora pallida]|uniref:Uncharacterized protein n=1 Tax=Micromonospora pallida TaxID=145854 RepID=A0A1C6SDP2_9ACTN|nr:hypothetical protein [Micromonospora pallida]SCL27602.1 hypothetical protein GA0074692_2379 [Micromonospora pallida]
MRRPTAFLLALVMALLTLVVPAGPAQADAWSGPQTTIVNRNGRKVIRLCDQGGACRTTTPFFMALNSQSQPVNNGDWRYVDYQAQLAAANTAAADMNVAPMLQVHLASTSDAFIDQLAGRLNQLNPRPYLMVRFYLQDGPPGAEPMRMQDLQGTVRDDTNGAGHPWTLDEAWLAYQEQQITRVLTRMDAQYPGRVMAVMIKYANGGEWFYRPYGWNDTTGKMLEWGDPNLCATGTDGVRACGLHPWTNDAGTRPGPRGRHSFHLGDYASSTQAGFCSWSGLPASLVPGCRAATTTERNNAVPGGSPPLSGASRGTVLDPADLNSLRAAKYHQYLSSRNVAAINRLLAKAKQVTGNRVLTGVFYGYLYGLAAELPVSGHNDLTTLVDSPYVDLVSAPYSYGNGRHLGYGFVPQGPPDSMRLTNKLWMDEDDTRTLFARPCPTPPGFQTATNLWDSIRLLRRNLATTAIGGRAQYFLDLQGCGWFGDPDRADESQTLWANLQSVFRAIDKIQHGGANAYQPQVAVFVDDVSPNHQPGLTPAGEHTYSYAVDQLPNLVDDLTRLGTPVRHYLLSDLTKGNLDLSAIKLAILPNAYVVSSTLRSAINTKLKTPGRTVLSQYAAGYVQDNQAASTASMTALTGITVARGNGTPALSQNYSFVGQSGGPAYPLTPWFTVTDPGATTLGSYQVGGVSLARKVIPVAGGSYTSVYAAAPKLPLAALRRISEDAGVHHFAPAGDTVEAAGNMLMVHAGSSGTKTVRLPQSMPRVYETALYPSDVEMCRNCTQLANLPFNQGDTRVFRWTSPPRGNFELLTGATVEGWAADLDQPATSSAVAVYRGGPAGVGTYLGDFPTATNRPDVNAYFGITGVHGFRFTLAGCSPGTQIHVYALDPEGGNGDGSTYLGARSCT